MLLFVVLLFFCLACRGSWGFSNLGCRHVALVLHDFCARVVFFSYRVMAPRPFLVLCLFSCCVTSSFITSFPQ